MTSCTSCDNQLIDSTSPCPECGARITGPAAIAAGSPLRPTLVLPGASLPAPQQREEAAAPEPGGPTLGQGLPSLPDTSSARATAARPQRLWLLLGGLGCLGVLVLGLFVTAGAFLLIWPATSTASVAPVEEQTAPGQGSALPIEPPLGIGTLLRDDFDDPLTSGMGANEDASSRYSYDRGAYMIEVKEADTTVWSLVGGVYEDISVEVETEIASGSGGAAAGLVFHYQNVDNFYLFSVANDGYFALELLEGNEWVTLVEWQQASALHPVRNTLRVETRGDWIWLYANDQLLIETRDETFTNGEVGLATSSFSTSSASVRFDNLLISRNR